MMATTRTVLPYDDITTPYGQPDVPSSSSHNHRSPPPKKRKKGNPRRRERQLHRNAAEFPRPTGASSTEISSKQQPQQEQWDVDAEEGEYGYGNEDGEEEESRELTHEEIWDDSALVDAWESAMEEYKAYHGLEKGWKKEPVKKSPLWYNVPVDLSTKAEKAGPSSSTISRSEVVASVHCDDLELDSQPLNFDTFVPTHDPSLDIPSDSAPTPLPVPDTNYVPAADEGPVVSQDEAFSRALNAMYWGGYWTAMYHAQRHLATTTSNVPTGLEVAEGTAEDEEDGEDLETGEQIEVDDDDFTSTQR